MKRLAQEVENNWESRENIIKTPKANSLAWELGFLRRLKCLNKRLNHLHIQRSLCRWKYFNKGHKKVGHMFKKNLFTRLVTFQRYKTISVLVLRLPFGSLRNFDHFNVIHEDNSKVCYKGGR